MRRASWQPAVRCANAGWRFFCGLPGLCHAVLKEVKRQKLTRKFGRVTFYTWGIYVSSCFFFPVGGGQFFGGEKSCHFWCCNEAHPTREVEDTACCSSSLVNRPMGIPQLKGDSTLSGRTASHNHQTSTGNDQSPKRYRVSSLKSPFTSKHACYNTLPWLTGVFEEVSWTLEFSLDIWKHTHSLYRKTTTVILEPSPYTVDFYFSLVIRKSPMFLASLEFFSVL